MSDRIVNQGCESRSGPPRSCTLISARSAHRSLCVYLFLSEAVWAVQLQIAGNWDVVDPT